MKNIEQELATCRERAEEGYKIADEFFEKLEIALHDEKENLRQADNKQDKISRLENDEHFKKQFEEISEMEREIVNSVDDNLSDLKEKMSDFTIVLYGRTMAGKSTLMEILKHGNGESIGKGAQRTTLDVRAYKWNGLKIFDVPGTCSFGGEEDDKLAYEAAKSADLALFLLTDDAPQPYEADRLAELKKLGKPVLGIINVKQVLSDKENPKRKIELKKLEKKISDTARLQEIEKQFKEFSQKSGYNFDDIKFVYSHLQSAFFSQRENDSELYNLSNFSAVENFILDKVTQDGKFIRIKTFIDAVARPMQDSIFKLYGHSAESYFAWQTYSEKISLLDDWFKNFQPAVEKRLDNFMDGLKSELNSKIDYIVANYYESSRAGEHWQTEVEKLNINKRCQNFIKSIGEDATKKMRDLSDELTQDLKYSGASVKTSGIWMEEITDWQGGIMAVAPFLAFVPGVGWAGAAIIGGLAWLFGDSKEEKIRKAKNELRDKLNDSRNEILKNAKNGIKKIIDQEIFEKQISGFREILFKMYEMLAKLAYTQNKISDVINEEYRELNLELLCNAIEYAGGRPRRFKNLTTARAIGENFITFGTSIMPDSMQGRVEKVLGEKFSFCEVSEKDYWIDAVEFFDKNFLHNQLGLKNFIDEGWGRMDLIDLPDFFARKENSAKVHLAEQILESPVIFVHRENNDNYNFVMDSNLSEETYQMIYREIKNILVATTEVKFNDIFYFSKLADDLGIEDFERTLYIMGKIEKIFNVRIPNDFIERITTVDDAIKVVANFINIQDRRI